MLRYFLIFALFYPLISCGESPLFNHKKEGKNFINPVLSESEAILFPKMNYSFIISWVEGPRLGASKFIMKTWNPGTGTMNGPYEDLPKQLYVFLWMPAMGHGSAPVKLKRIGDGEYEISEAQFIMGGKWEIKFQLKNGPQVIDEAIVPVSL